MNTLTHLFRTPRRKILSLLLIAGILIVTAIPVWAGGAPSQSPRSGQSQQPYLVVTEMSGEVFYEYQPGLKAQERRAKVGDRLTKSGEGIRTGSGSRATLAVDRGIGSTQLSENTDLRVKNLNTSRNGATNTQLAMNRGRVRAKVRSFNNPRSNFSIQTPTGVAGVRGTEFIVIVLPNGETRISTLDGAVAVSAQNQTQEVRSGYSSTIVPGNSPTPPALTNANLRVSLELLPAPDTGKVRVSGVVNPINSVSLDEQILDLDTFGQFNTVVSLPADGRLRLIVRNPFGEEQLYELIAPGGN
ncbi:MAG TPA: FecR family protein [Leptolyngbyaceae cyanobacterium]